jgi:hypothetical protein
MFPLSSDPAGIEAFKYRISRDFIISTSVFCSLGQGFSIFFAGVPVNEI